MTERRGAAVRVSEALLLIALIGAMALSVYARLVVGQKAPLWIDEAWTGAIAGQPSWTATLRQTWLDANAPVYYLLMHLWTGLAGQSNLALRAPSVLIGVLVPVLPLVLRAPGLARADRFLWAGLLAVWIQGINLSGLARCYALLEGASLIETVAFMRLLERPDRRRGFVFSALAALCVLVHYQALMLVAAQGLVLLARERGRIWRLAPAALGFFPAAAVLAWHAPRLALFARPDVAWYDYVSWRTVDFAFDYMVGPSLVLLVPAAGLIVLGADRALGVRRKEGAAWEAWAAALASLLAVGFILGAGAIRPSFTLRYLTPMVPGLALLITLGARAVSPVLPPARALLLAALVVNTGLWVDKVKGYTRRLYNYETASADLAARNPSRVVFVWDHPAQAVEDPSQYAAAGGFFFHRAGSRALILPVLFRPGDDPSRRLLAEAADDPRAAILWVYDKGVRGTFAARSEPRISALDPTFACRQYAAGRFGVYACIRTPREEEARP